MARPRTPTANLQTRGAFIKHPERARERRNEPDSSAPVGNPPERLTEIQLKAWAEILWTAHPGSVGINDRLAIESFARLLVKEWDDKLTGAERSALRSYQAAFGMTPSDRSKIAIRPQPKASPLDEFAIN